MWNPVSAPALSFLANLLAATPPAGPPKERLRGTACLQNILSGSLLRSLMPEAKRFPHHRVTVNLLQDSIKICRLIFISPWVIEKHLRCISINTSDNNGVCSAHCEAIAP